MVKSTQRTIGDPLGFLRRRETWAADIGLLNNQSKRLISNIAPNKTDSLGQYISPWFITGFTDGEGTFGIFLQKSTSSKIGVTIIPLFQIGLHKKDEKLLQDIRANLGGIGSISYGLNTVFLKVQSLKEILTVVIPHFDKYPLITQKQADYLLFRQIVSMMERKEHLIKKNLQTIVNIKASLNLGLSEDLKERFPKTVPVPRPPVAKFDISNPE